MYIWPVGAKISFRRTQFLVSVLAVAANTPKPCAGGRFKVFTLEFFHGDR